MAKSFVLQEHKGQSVVFTPRQYDSRTGLLHGVSHNGLSMWLNLAAFLPEHIESKLNWDDEAVIGPEKGGSDEH